MLSLHDALPIEKQIKHDISVVVDRLQVKASAKQRLTDSVETALRLADGLVTIDYVDNEELTHTYSEKASCPNGHPLTIEEYEPRAFSFNAPFGSCPACDGIGTKTEEIGRAHV